MKKILRWLIDIPLYTKIFIGFALGAIWGILFNVPYNKIELTYINAQNETKKFSTDWDKLIITDGNEIVFFSKERAKILEYSARLLKSIQNIEVSIIKNDVIVFSSDKIKRIDKVKTLATQTKWLGNIFMRLLSLLAIPLVLASLIVGAASLEDVRKLGKIGSRAFILYVSTTVLAIIIGLALANTIKPGKMVAQETKIELLSEYKPIDTISSLEINFTEYIENIVPRNPFRAIATGEMLQIVFFAVFFGVAINFAPREKTKYVVNFFSGFSEIMITMVGIVMKVAPIGVFALIAATIAEFGFDIIITLLFYILTVLIGLLLQIAIVYTLMVKFLGKLNPIDFLKKMRVAQLVALSTSSSAATLPVTMDCVENKIGVPKKVSGFVLPLGATINMDGTALYQGVASVFIAQVYGMDLTIYQQLTVVLTAVLASIGTAPVPGVGILMLVMILNSINVPAEGIALILGVDRLLDMCRTVPNITGDAAVAVSVYGLTEKKNEV